MEKFRSSQLPTAYTVYHDNCNTATQKKPYTNSMFQHKKTTYDNRNDKNRQYNSMVNEYHIYIKPTTT